MDLAGFLPLQGLLRVTISLNIEDEYDFQGNKYWVVILIRKIWVAMVGILTMRSNMLQKAVWINKTIILIRELIRNANLTLGRC